MTKINQIADYYRRRILSGELKPGDELPSISEMAASHDACQMTVVQARAVLRNEGLMVAAQGRAAYVTPSSQWRDVITPEEMFPDDDDPWDVDYPEPRFIVLIDLGGKLVPAESRTVKMDNDDVIEIVTPKAA